MGHPSPALEVPGLLSIACLSLETSRKRMRSDKTLSECRSPKRKKYMLNQIHRKSIFQPMGTEKRNSDSSTRPVLCVGWKSRDLSGKGEEAYV